MRTTPAVATVGRVTARGTRELVVDGALALAFAALSLSLIASFDMPAGGFEHPAGVGVALALVHTLAIAWRRRAPLAVLAVCVLTGIGYAATGLPVVGLGPAIVVPVYTVAAELDRRRSLTGLAAVEAGALVAQLLAHNSAGWDTDLGNAVVLAAAWLLGDQARRRRQEAAAHADRARRLEQAEGELARHAVADERLRIARELHDVVAHSMSVIAVQAGTGRLVIDEDPAAAREALAVIETASRQTLDELRRLLDVLRSDDEAAGPLVPTPGLADLDGLVAQVVSAGLPVEVRVEGDRRPLPAGVDLTAFRIVQEALTNVRRHARASSAHVVLRYGADRVRIEVTDDGASGKAANGSGHGIAGMRERAALYGGTLDAEPAASGGFRVTASLPYEASRR
jgi:signal transduction histidine kinase